MTSPRTGRAYLDEVRSQPGAVLAFAHRGGATHPDLVGLENTLVAFEHAAGLGYRYLETDVHRTSDGVLLAFHDDKLDRVTDSAGTIASLSAAEVSEARVGGREPVPLLSDLLDALPQARFNIDVKGAGTAEPLAEMIDARGLHDQILVGSFSQGHMRDFRRASAGRVATSATPVEVTAFLTRRGPLARRALRDLDAFQVPHRRGPLTIVTRSFVRRAHAAGKHVHIWVVDDPAEADEMLELDVDGLMTDRTDLLRDHLVARDRWLEAP